MPVVGVALALLFIGGAFGKATCAWLGERFGVIGTVVITEAATALLIAATLFTTLTPTLILLPLLGIVLNGTSSVLYGTVPELSDGDTGRAFAVLYKRHRRRRFRAHRLWHDCRSQQPNDWAAGLVGNCRPDRPTRTSVATLSAQLRESRLMSCGQATDGRSGRTVPIPGGQGPIIIMPTWRFAQWKPFLKRR